MIDWRVSEEEPPFPELPESDPSGPSRRAWHFVALLALLLVVAAGTYLRWRLDDRTQLMRANLTEFIQLEERQRQFGLTEEAKRLVVREVPARWYEGYLASFPAPDEVAPVELTVEAIELADEGALATVHVTEEPQVRFYQLAGRQWRRAPLPADAWGEPSTIRLPEHHLTIHYRARDAAFARRLEADLPSLLRDWPLKSTVEQIVVEPREFGPTVLAKDETRIVLNSPLLLAPGSHLSAESVLRLTLAETLLLLVPGSHFSAESAPRASLAEAALLAEPGRDSDATAPLDGALRFRAATRQLLLLRWALPPATYTEFRAGWQAIVREREWYRSPFLGPFVWDRATFPLRRPWKPAPTEAVTLLVADYLYEQRGPTGVQAVIEQLPAARSWDSFFYPLLGQYTVEVEATVVEGGPPGEERGREAPENVPLVFPVSVRVEGAEADGTLLVRVAGRERPLAIETDQAPLVGPDDQLLPVGCAGLYKELTIGAGDWRVVGERLQARQVRVHDLEPAVTLPAATVTPPSNTIGYLIQATEKGERETFAAPSSLVAIQEDGRSVTLLRDTPLQRVWNWQPRSGERARFLFKWSVPGCQQVWLFLYEPGQGVTARWLTAPDWQVGEFTTFIQLPADEHILLITAPTERSGTGFSLNGDWQYGVLQPGELGLARPIGSWDTRWHPLGWSAATEQIIVLGFNDGLDVMEVKLLDPSSGTASDAVRLPTSHFSYCCHLTVEGTHLLYGAGMDPEENAETEPAGIHLLELATGEDTLLVAAEEGERLMAPSSLGAFDLLLLLTGRQSADWSENEYLIAVDSRDPGTRTVVAELTPGEAVRHALPCSDGRVLYSVERYRRTSVRLWHPNGTTTTVIEGDQSVSALACR